ncbi:MAG: ABC transporter substrate-binding protein [Desulfovibrionaceae bacterium]|nr:ABC transporter substrate-binding protein [Desulfovibrionaceae bacterium]
MQASFSYLCQKTLKTLLGSLALGCLALALLASPARAGEVAVTDALGRETIVSLPVRRLVVLNSDALEAVRILKAQDLVVGVDASPGTRPWFWGPLAGLPRAGTWREANLEAIVALRPDLVLCYGQRPGPELETRLAPLGVPVLRLDFYKAQTLAREMAALGEILDRKARAAEFLDWHTGLILTLAAIRDKAGSRPLVYSESYSAFHAHGPGSGGFDLVELAGGRNISQGLGAPYPQVTPEWIVSRDPEVIVKAVPSGAGDENARERLERAVRDILARPCLANVRAARQGRVYALSGDLLAGPGLAAGLAYLVKWLHPDLAADLDGRAVYAQYLRLFQDQPLTGACAWPEDR